MVLNLVFFNSTAMLKTVFLENIVCFKRCGEDGKIESAFKSNVVFLFHLSNKR